MMNAIRFVMTDNGSAFRGRVFQAACSALANKHKRTRPYTPRTNGKVERLIQTLLREWAYRFEYTSSAERKRWLTPYMHPPISRLVRKNVLRRNS